MAVAVSGEVEYVEEHRVGVEGHQVCNLLIRTEGAKHPVEAVEVVPTGRLDARHWQMSEGFAVDDQDDPDALDAQMGEVGRFGLEN